MFNRPSFSKLHQVSTSLTNVHFYICFFRMTSGQQKKAKEKTGNPCPSEKMAIKTVVVSVAGGMKLVDY